MFHIGQLVVCVDAAQAMDPDPNGYVIFDVNLLERGQVYTVRSVEMHQFRVEAAANAPGLPTPEGVHHDGVDVVLIAMLARTNLKGGETLVTDDVGAEHARFTLDGMLDLAVLDDRRVMHGVTPVEPADAALPSSRDVLVLTWKRAALLRP